MRFRKRFFNIELSITFLLLVLGMALVWIASFDFLNLYISGLLLNISAGCFSSVITIWGIEFFRRKSDKNRKSEILNVAFNELEKLGNMSFSYVANPLGFRINYTSNGRDPDNYKIRNLMINQIDTILKGDLSALIQKMTPEEWKMFTLDGQFLQVEIQDFFSTYITIFEPELQGSLLNLRVRYRQFHFAFALMHELYLKEEKDWPINKLGVVRNRENKQYQSIALAKNLVEYFQAVRTLLVALNQL